MLARICYLLILLFDIAAAGVFVEKQAADAVLSRWRRANTGFLEELKQGNLERECREEICDYEEAREVFEDEAMTRQFWDTYDRRDPCKVNPCLNNGVCVDAGTGFRCQCAEGFEGRFCQMVFEDSLKCIYHNGQCQHFCDGSGKRRKCSCAEGYMLGEDGRQCIPQVEFPCGQLAPTNQSMMGQTRLVGSDHSTKGELPWQVLIQLNGASHCGGVLIRPDRVLTAAHCVSNIKPDKLIVVAGEHNLDADDGTEQRIPVSTVIVHENYKPATGDSDIALLHLSRNASLNSNVITICLPTKELAEHELLLLRYHTVSGWGKRTIGGNNEGIVSGGVPISPILRKMSVPIIQNSQCTDSSRFNFTDNMLCAGYLAGDQESCRGDDGSPMTTLYGSTHFLSGVVGWGKGCTIRGYFGVYTKVSKFVDWVESRNTMAPDMMQQVVSQIPTCELLLVNSPSDVMFCFGGVSLGVLFFHLAAAHVFLGNDEASQVLMRARRANKYFEELKQGDMERECREERCSWEEAREIFEDDDETNKFWAVYYDGDACRDVPCAHRGRCEDGIGRYTCYCDHGYDGSNCEIVIPQLCENQNGGCQHFCKVEQGNIECSCADGYVLSSDEKSCESNDPFKCGVTISTKTRTIFTYQRPNITEGNVTEFNQTHVEGNDTSAVSLTEMSSAGNDSSEHMSEYKEDEEITSEIAGMTRIVNGENCPPGECPWQALLMDENDRGFCGGTILNEYIILTAAHCMNHTRYISVRLGEFDLLVNEGTEATHYLDSALTHKLYRPDTFHNDIALLKLATPIKFSKYILPACLPDPDFAEKVLMVQKDGLVSGFGRLAQNLPTSTILQRLTVPYVPQQTCKESSNFRISTHMFCAGYDKIAMDSCRGDSGGPHVTVYKNTYFVTGIVSWGEGCAKEGKYGIYTQVSKFNKWIRYAMKKLLRNDKGADRVRRQSQPIRRLYL
ncbi:coagulation factor X [Syngnathus scovelli]|uniref:coagulation factor X n=1 Tax=Syngnathus scovelli TaxID=161590 RepID=UPI0035CBC5AB